jgi:transcription initiation factor IIE alpha subunit
VNYLFVAANAFHPGERSICVGAYKVELSDEQESGFRCQQGNVRKTAHSEFDSESICPKCERSP